MKKIALTGAHSMGKTTGGYHLAAELKRKGYKVEIIPEQARLCPFGINKEMPIETSYWIVCNHIKLELEAEKRQPDFIISDRTPLDTLIYAFYLNVYEAKHGALYDFAAQWLFNYDKILLLQNDNEIVADGIRSLDENFRNSINKFLENELTRLQKNDLIKFNIINFSDYKTLEEELYKNAEELAK